MKFWLLREVEGDPAPLLTAVQYTYDLSSGNVVTVTFSSPDFTAEDVETLREYLALQARVRAQQAARKQSLQEAAGT